VTDIRHIAAGSSDYTKFDAVIVGSGPSGSMVARTLAEKGCHVALLEYGGLVSPGAILGASQAAYSKALTSNRPADGNPWTACCVGGGMRFYNAITFRYRQADLLASRYLTTDMEIDWPITLLDLEPYYRAAPGDQWRERASIVSSQPARTDVVPCNAGTQHKTEEHSTGDQATGDQQGMQRVFSVR
jgi:choline dehydrogenase-like flavoprotein